MSGLLSANSAVAASNPRYASLVIDADSGQVLHAENANSRRYPASLTKMMTLYLAFEAMKQGKMNLSTRMLVSKKAAGMPQTNISLRAGQTITLKQAIDALVVRSANDVAVVVAEHLGKTEWGFALKMTAKARALGMNSTVFRNASGLPDDKQYTTARDLAVLAVALRKHFPEYYNHFRTSRFTFQGVTYTTHNRVNARLPGADGLKTGFIRASGFNLATSAKRNGRSLVGVVLGGLSGTSRDHHMIDLMERSFAQIDKGLPVQHYASVQPEAQPSASVPVPVAKPQQFAAKEESKPVQLASASLMNDSAQVSSQPMVMGKPPSYLQAPEAQPRGQFQPVSYTTAMPTVSADSVTASQGWGIQVGAFSAEREAMMAAAHAASLAPSELTAAKIVVTGSTGTQGKAVHRARLQNLTEDQARQACRAIIARSASCFVYRSDAAQSQL